MKKLFILFLFVFASFALVPAQANFQNYSIQDSYIYGDTVSGWINVSFDSEPLDSLFTDSEGNSVSLEDFLNISGHTYECSTKDCLPDFMETEASSTKQFTLNKNESTILGFKLTGDIEQINSVNFTIQSDAGVSNSNQLRIDFLNDGEIETGNTKVSSQLSAVANYGCYNNITSFSETPISETPYCQAINLSEAPGFQLGAWIKKDVTGTNNIKMELYGKDSQTPLESCTIQNSAISTIGSSQACPINYLVSKEEVYYVCIKREVGQSLFYAHATDSQKCGFKGKPLRDYVASYDIFVKPYKFDSVGTFKIENILPNKDSLNYLFEDYIDEKYDSLDCSTGCNVPIKILSNTDNQKITISNIIINYDKAGFNAKEQSIYNSQEVPSKVTSDYQKTNLDGIFSVKSKTKTRDYTLRFDDKKIIDKEPIEVKNISFSLFPTTTVADYPTNFVVYTSSDDSYVEYFWDFGDNKNLTTSLNSTTHSYDKIGNYTLKVSMKKFGGGSITKAYEIVVDSPKKLIESKLELMKSSLVQIKTAWSKLSTEEQILFEDKIDLVELESKIESIETKYKLSTSENDYEAIVEEILNLNVPQGLIRITSPEAPFFTKEEDISVKDIKALGVSSNVTNSDEEIINSILYWNAKNLVVTSSLSEAILTYSNGEEKSIKKFSLTIKPENSGEEYNIFYNPYLLTPVGLGENNNEETTAHIKRSGTTKIEFLTTEDLTLANLPVSISPKISELSLIGEIPESTDKSKGWIIIIALFSLAVFGLLIYNILRKWYKTKYEKYLFSDRNNLYNVMIYVNNSKKQGLENSEIKKNLSRAGWSSEQIRYIMRKFDNKETGMPELTLKKRTRELSKMKKNKPSANINKKHTNLNK